MDSFDWGGVSCRGPTTKPYFLDNNDVPLVICRSNETWYACLNLCPGCGGRFEGGTVMDGVLSCDAGHRYELGRAGRSLDQQELNLKPFPLIVEAGQMKVALGAAYRMAT